MPKPGAPTHQNNHLTGEGPGGGEVRVRGMSLGGVEEGGGHPAGLAARRVPHVPPALRPHLDHLHGVRLAHGQLARLQGLVVRQRDVVHQLHVLQWPRHAL